MSNWPLDKLLAEMEEKYSAEGISDYWPAEKEAIARALPLIALQLPQDRYTPTRVIGVGGSGIVLQLTDQLFREVDVALKVPRPVEGKIREIGELLEKEIRYLAELRLPGLVSITHYGRIEDQASMQVIPYYMMNYVEGAKSRTYFAGPKTSATQFKRILLEVAETLARLHMGTAERFVHLDIKADNIMITADHHPVIIDLGTCKRLRADETQTIVMCTRGNAHPELIRKLVQDPSDENRSRGELPRSEIRVDWDLWALAITILEWMGLDKATGEVAARGMYSRLDAYSRKYYLLLVARMMTYSIPQWLSNSLGLHEAVLRDFPIIDANQLCDCLRRVEDGCGPLQETAELHPTSSGSIQAAPGIHVALTEALNVAVNHRLYRRLNNITQLGLVSQVFPGAKQSRREHSLGTYANTGRLLSALYNDTYSPFFKQIVTREDCRAVLLAALFHDIGQFPLAHDLEEIDKSIFSHAELTQAMLKGEWKRAGKTIAFPSLDGVFGAWGIARERVGAILGAKPASNMHSRRDKLLRSLFSSSIDADKLDYLLRDAWQTGVPYPLGIDIQRLLSCVTVVIISEAGIRDVPFIGVHAKGRVAAEFLTLARYAMFSQVYWHHAVRAQKAMLSRAVGALLAKLETPDDVDRFKVEFVELVVSLPEVLYTEPTQMEIPGLARRSGSGFGRYGEGTDLAPTDAAVLSWIGESLRNAGAPEATLIERILQRKLFKRLWVVSADMDGGKWRSISEAWDRLKRPERSRACREFERRIAEILTPESTRDVTRLAAQDAQDLIRDRVGAQVPWLLIDVPGGRAGSEVGLKYVLEGQRRQLRKNDCIIGETLKSELWEKYARDLRAAAGKVRVFCDPILVDIVESSVKPELGLEILEGALNAAADG